MQRCGLKFHNERFDAIATQMNELMHKQSVEWPLLTKTVDSDVRQAKGDKTTPHDEVAVPDVIEESATTTTVPSGPSQAESNFTEVRNKKWDRAARKNRKLVVGGSRDVKFQGVAKKTVVFVNRLDPGTTTDDVKEHLEANSIEVLSCFKITPNGLTDSETPRFIGMRLCVPLSHMDTVYRPEIWPDGVGETLGL